MAPIRVLLKWYPERLILWILVIAFSVVVVYKKSTKHGNASALMDSTLTGYTVFLFFFTVFSRLPVDFFRFELIPLHSYYEAVVNNNLSILLDSLLNIALFIPMGFLAKMKFHTLKHIWVYGMLTSLLIEVLQLILRRGYFEVDDIINNTVGFILGSILCRVAVKLQEKINK